MTYDEKKALADQIRQKVTEINGLIELAHENALSVYLENAFKPTILLLKSTARDVKVIICDSKPLHY